MASTIALLTDFGLEDAYVGVMKGVMRRICPPADFIDITHAIKPQNAREAALVLLGSYSYFPEETVFLVVVDPGVGSARRPVAVKAGGYTFVAPDNGVLTYVLQQFDTTEAVSLDNPDFHLETVSRTFHGRDIFAPAAAHLAAGLRLGALGEFLSNLIQLPVPRLDVQQNAITGEVIHIDHFGNVVTSIGTLWWLDEATLELRSNFGAIDSPVRVKAMTAAVKIDEQVVRGIHTTYSGAEPGDMLALVGSGGFLEVAVNQGSGAARLGAAIGDRVEVTW